MILAAAALALAAAAASAGPLKVRTLGTKSQQVVMCPDCNEKISCAKAGDYTIGFDADLDSPKTGAPKVAVHVKDQAGKPVEDAKAVATLTMPRHEHGKKPITLKNTGHGRYEAPTQLVMPGTWQTDVEVTPAGGDTVKQSFSFSK
jgi:nitrogen fixation protein FixH